MKTLISILAAFFFLACSCQHITPAPKPSQQEQLSTKTQEQFEAQIEKLLESVPKYSLELDHDSKPDSWDNFVPEIRSTEHVVDDEMADAFKNALDRAERDGAKDLVWIYSSKGGSYDVALKISQFMQRSPVKVHCVIDGNGMSGGFLILQSCGTRQMTTRSILMVHEASLTFKEATLNEWKLAELAQNLAATDHSMAVQEAARAKLTISDLERIVKNNAWYMNWDIALKFGFIDSALEDPEEEAVALRKKN